MSDDLVKRLRGQDCADCVKGMCVCDIVEQAADRIEQLEAALRELGETFVSSLTFKVADMRHKHDMPISREHAEEVYQELGRRIMIARAALEGKKDD